MKKVTLAIILLTLISTFSFAQREPQVYIVGTNINDAAYWRNNRGFIFERGAEANAIAISGSDVYIAGSVRSRNGIDPVYWQHSVGVDRLENGKCIILPKRNNNACGYSIAISGSFVYVAGKDGNDAVYWRNSMRYVLPKESQSAVAEAIFIAGSNIYIAGKDGNDAVYWLNDRRFVLPKEGRFAVASGVAIFGTDVYIVGTDILGEGYSPFGDAVYWLNGKRIALPKTGMSAYATAIAVSGSNVYITGRDYRTLGHDPASDAVYWHNGRYIKLSSNNFHNRSGANTIVISGFDIYIAGFSDSYTIDDAGNIIDYAGSGAVYWLDGRQYILPKVSNYADAKGIIVIR